MHSLPVKNGRPCVYRVVRVSGTIKVLEEEALRRAKLLIHAAKEEMTGKPSSAALGVLLRGKDVAMVVDDESVAGDEDEEMEDDG